MNQSTAPRRATLQRRTSETDISVEVNLDGTGESAIETGVGFFDHMLTHVARHGPLDLKVRAKGDLHIDDHHTVEDVGIVLGQAVGQALGDRAGIERYGQAIVPMDEALVLCAVDVSGRGMSVCQLEVGAERVGEFATEMAPEFLRAFAHNAGLTVHVRQLDGSNAHHVLEAAFKALGRALGMAMAKSDWVHGVPSTKGVL
ncbi:MAG TPA: imidazoleglycerol-phosphate dehydratase HisB [Chthonomonadales bacterium]|nr:imidazoleglycerol-phosphate dehydratase HisB [Chthonomonadales bacterium]